MTIETAHQAMEHLNKRKGWRIEMVNANLYLDHYSDGEPIEYTARKLIKLAKVFSSDNNQNTAVKENVKLFSKRKNRTKTRDAIKTEDFDKIPGVNDVMATDDPWNWD